MDVPKVSLLLIIYLNTAHSSFLTLPIMVSKVIRRSRDDFACPHKPDMNRKLRVLMSLQNYEQVSIVKGEKTYP